MTQFFESIKTMLVIIFSLCMIPVALLGGWVVLKVILAVLKLVFQIAFG